MESDENCWGEITTVEQRSESSLKDPIDTFCQTSNLEFFSENQINNSSNLTRRSADLAAYAIAAPTRYIISTAFISISSRVKF